MINGGIINAYGTNARLGAGDWMVVEADESDGTFLKLPADIAIVTNIDAEHLDHFKTFAAVQEAFVAFVENVPFYGFAVMCTDHPIVQRLVGRIEDRRIITYGENPQADVRLVDLSNAGGQLALHRAVPRPRRRDRARDQAISTLPMPGRHNALNATSAIAVAHELKIPDDAIRKALAGFGGVKRRFTRTGEWNGVTIIDDYGHHPVEIAAVLKAARESTKGQVIAVVQPHRYTRLQSLFEPFSTCFNDADAVIVAEVYPAGEAPIDGVDRDHLVHRRARARPPPGDAAAGPAAARRHREGHRQAGRLRGLPRRRQHHAMGLCAAGRAEGAGHMSFPDIVPDLKSRCPKLRGRLLAEPVARRTDLVPRRRTGAGAVHAGGRGRPRLFPRRASRRNSGDGGRPRLQPDRARRRRAGRRDPARPRLQRDHGREATASAPAPRCRTCKVARAAQEAGLAGLAFLRGIPGAIGGALRMNGGAYGGETKDVLVEARARRPRRAASTF